MPLQLRNKDDVQDSVKFFAQVQVDDIVHSFLIHQHHEPITEDVQNWQAWISLGEAMLAITNHIFIFHSFQDDLPHDLPRHWGETEQLLFSSVFLIFLFEDESYVSSFPVSRNFTVLSWLLKYDG